MHSIWNSVVWVTTLHYWNRVTHKISLLCFPVLLWWQMLGNHSTGNCSELNISLTMKKDVTCSLVQRNSGTAIWKRRLCPWTQRPFHCILLQERTCLNVGVGETLLPVSTTWYAEMACSTSSVSVMWINPYRGQMTVALDQTVRPLCKGQTPQCQCHIRLKLYPLFWRVCVCFPFFFF